MTDYNNKALLFAEKYGIFDYTVKHSRMIYYTNYPPYLHNKRYTIKTIINLRTMQEQKIKLKKYRRF